MEGDEGSGLEAVREKEESKDTSEVAKKAPREVLPTGRVVGVTKRNWRA